MIDVKKCQNCIWYDQCGQDVACEDYDPVSPAEDEARVIQEYYDDLRERDEYYKEQIDEQNS